MKHLSLLLLLAIPILSFSQEESIIINHHEFSTAIEEIDLDYGEGEYLVLYRDNKKLLAHNLYKVIGDCSSENIELGTYEIKGSTITFYTYWASADRMMNNIYPYGFRKQMYTIDQKGLVQLQDAQLYIETRVDPWNLHEGLKYVNQTSRTLAEDDLANDYIAKVNQEYSGRFVLGNNISILEREVRSKLKEEIAESTGYWDEVYGQNCRK